MKTWCFAPYIYKTKKKENKATQTFSPDTNQPFLKNFSKLFQGVKLTLFLTFVT